MFTMDPLVRNKHGCPQGVIKLHQRPNFHQILMRLDPCHCQEYLQRHRHHRKSLAIRRLNGWPTLHSMAGLNRTNLPETYVEPKLTGNVQCQRHSFPTDMQGICEYNLQVAKNRDALGHPLVVIESEKQTVCLQGWPWVNPFIPQSPPGIWNCSNYFAIRNRKVKSQGILVADWGPSLTSNFQT